MASITKRRARDGSSHFLVTVRRVGFPTVCETFPTKPGAVAWGAAKDRAARLGTLSQNPRMTLAELIDAGVPRLERPVAAAFAYWREALGERRLSQVTPSLLAEHRDLLLGAPCGGWRNKRLRPRSTATVRNYLTELSRLFALAVRELHVIESNPVRNVKKPKASEWRKRFLYDDERVRLLAACKESTNPDLYPFVLFALTTGCRRGEAYGLHWSDVDLTRRWAVFPKTKNGDARGVPLTVAVADLLRARERTNERVFPVDITKAWRNVLAAARVENFRFHDLRHSAASRLVQTGANLVEVATLLGHRGVQMTARYAHVANDHTSRLVDRVMGGLS